MHPATHLDITLPQLVEQRANVEECLWLGLLWQLLPPTLDHGTGLGQRHRVVALELDMAGKEEREEKEDEPW